MLPISRALSSIALRVSRSPIESIVGVFVLTTLAYFHVLAAVKQSNFLQPGPAIPDAQQPVLALRRSVSPEWISLSVDAPYAPRLELLPVVLPVHALERDDALLRFLTNQLTTQHGQKYPQLCFSINASCVTAAAPNSLTLAFSPGATGQYLQALAASALPPAEDGTHLKVVQSPETIVDMRSGRWIAYAGRALVVRFWNLAKVSVIAIAPAPNPSTNASDMPADLFLSPLLSIRYQYQNADSADIIVILVGYVLMHLTFANTFIKARKLGSSFWLAACVIISSTFAFVLSLPIAIALDIPVDPVTLSEALPFLVVTVGFDKPLQLARAVFTHPAFAPSTPPSTPVSASQVVQEAVARTGPSVIRDYAIEIALLILGAVSGVSGLKEFCRLAALILAADCIALFTLYIAVLNIMVEVRF